MGINVWISEFLSSELAPRVIDIMMIVFFALLMFTYDLLLTLVGIVAVAALAALTMLVNRRRIDGNRRLLSEEGKATGC